MGGNDGDNRFKIHAFTGMIYLIIAPVITYFTGRIPIHLFHEISFFLFSLGYHKIIYISSTEP